MKDYSEADYIGWLDTLANHDYVVIDDFLSVADLSDIQLFFSNKLQADALEKAGIGALFDHTINEKIRGDYIYWVNQDIDQSIQGIFDQTNTLINQIKRHCFLSISDFECHLAQYPEGSFYKPHFDQFKERNNRIISFVLYLNENWLTGDGGELIIDKNGKKTAIEPIENRLILFKSATVLHEVAITNKSRHSLTGWMLNNPVGLGFL